MSKSVFCNNFAARALTLMIFHRKIEIKHSQSHLIIHIANLVFNMMNIKRDSKPIKVLTEH